MAGHKAWCRFNNSKVAWNHSGFAFVKESRGPVPLKPERKEPEHVTLRKEALQAVEKYTEDEPINKIVIKFAKS